MSKFSVYAGNVGNVLDTDSESAAIRTANDYARGNAGSRCDGTAVVIDNSTYVILAEIAA
jgi:hypothetical protein